MKYECELDEKSYNLVVYRQIFTPVSVLGGTRYIDTGQREEFEDWEDHLTEGALYEVFKLASGMGFVEIVDAGLTNEVAKGQFTISEAREQPKLSRQYPRFKWLPVKHIGEALNKKGDRVGGIRFV